MRRRLGRLIVLVVVVGTVVCVVLKRRRNGKEEEPSMKRKEGLDEDREGSPCGSLLATHVRSPVARGLARNASEVLGPLGEVTDFSLIASCGARVLRWTSALGVRRRLPHDVFEVAVTHSSVREFLALLDDGAMSSDSKRKRRSFDVVVVDAATLSFGELLGEIDEALDIADKALLLTSVNDIRQRVPSASDLTLALLRARYDVDAALVSTFDGGVAFVLKRENTNPLELETLGSEGRGAVEWPRAATGGAQKNAREVTQCLEKELTESLFSEKKSQKSRETLLNLLAADTLFDEWLYRGRGRLPIKKNTRRHKTFGTELLALARDAQRWREACFDDLHRISVDYPPPSQQRREQQQLRTTGPHDREDAIAAAAACFKGLSDTRPFHRKEKDKKKHMAPRRAADVVPETLLLAALGRFAGPVDDATAEAFLRAAALFAKGPYDDTPPQ